MKEKKVQRLTFWVLVLMGGLYFCALIPANRTGAETAEMLAVFEVDEYAQYPHLLRMLAPGDGLYPTLRNFFIYLHYYYGFPFYFWSALSVLPLKLLSPDWPRNTRMIVCVLRQMISVLPMILSAGLLTWIATKFRKLWTSLVLFVLMLTMGAVLQNDFWWHPDSLTLLFLSLTFFFLDRDRMRCGRDFLFAAFACGAAVGTKYLGLYFALAIPAYLICCRIAKSITTRQVLVKAVLFLLVMAAAILFSDPLLLLPQERAEIIGVMKQQTELSGEGIFLRYENVFWENGHLPEWLTENYLRVPWLVLAVFSLAAGMFSGKRRVRTMAVVLFCYLLIACTVNLNTAASRLHYFLPILLPLSAAFPMLPELFPNDRRKYVEGALVLLMAVQIGLNLPRDMELMNIQLHREENSGSIALFHELESNYLPLPEVPAERMTRVYRDWKVYFPESGGYAVKTDWDLANFALIEEWHPDLILLEKENVRTYSAPDVSENAVNAEKMAETAAFYSAAAENAVPGYELMLENNFGMVFRKVQP